MEDAAIVGGGVIGCAIALQLAEAGLNVVVVDKGEPGKESSYAAGGMLTPAMELSHADAFFDLALSSRNLYADYAKKLYALSGIDIEYRSEGTICPAFSESEEEELNRKIEFAQLAGMRVEFLKGGAVRELEPQLSFKTRAALKFPDDHQVNSRRFIQALYAASLNAGVRFLNYTQVSEIKIESNTVTGIITSKGDIYSKKVIIAAGSWSGLLQQRIPVKPIRGQMIAFEMPSPPIKHVLFSHRGYLIPRLAGFVIAGSTTEDIGFDKRNTGEGLRTIIDIAAEIAPDIVKQPIVEIWSGLRPGTSDHKPILGPDPDVNGLYYATGHYRNGILLTPITAQIIGDLIVKGESPINIEAFAISRFF